MQVRDNVHYIVDLRRLLEEYLLPGKLFADLGVTLPSGPVLINSSDPATSNSGMTLAQLELATVASGNPYQPATPAQAGASIGKVKALIDAQGLMRTGSDSAFERWVIQQTGGLLEGYENQLLQWITTRNAGVVPPGIVTLSPEPTIFNDHPILTLTESGQALIKAIEDDEVQDIAWKRYGFRSPNPGRRAGIRGRGRACDSSPQEDAGPRIRRHQTAARLLRERPVLIQRDHHLAACLAGLHDAVSLDNVVESEHVRGRGVQ